MRAELAELDAMRATERREATDKLLAKESERHALELDVARLQHELAAAESAKQSWANQAL